MAGFSSLWNIIVVTTVQPTHSLILLFTDLGGLILIVNLIQSRITQEESLSKGLSPLVGLWICLWGNIFIVNLCRRFQPTVDRTTPWIWVLYCIRVEWKWACVHFLSFICSWTCCDQLPQIPAAMPCRPWWISSIVSQNKPFLVLLSWTLCHGD